MGGEIHTTFGNAFSLGDFDIAANTHVSGEYTLAVNYDGTTSNLYVNGDLISQTTPSPAISAGVKDFILGKEFDGYVKNFKFWNYAKRFLTYIIAFHYGSFDTVYGDADVNAAAAAGHVFDNTPAGTYPWGTITLPSTASNQTTYTWTPVSQITNAQVLIVGAGGSGNSSGGSNGGGSGAGEIQFLQSTTITNSSKTVIIGNYVTNSNGNSSTFDGTTAIGGGVGGAMESTGGSGGSGGGSGSADGGTVKTPGSATGTGYGNSGGYGYKGDDNNRSGGGGGGAGGAGGNAVGYEPGAGGIGMDFSSNFGTIYGEDGWFAGGGSGGPRSTPSPRWRKGGKGGGSIDSTTGNGLSHSGGGAQPGISGTADGGSGIVLIKY